MLEKNLEFVPSMIDNIVAFNLSLMLLSAEVDSISKKQGCKKDAFIACTTGYVKIIFLLLANLVTLYIQAFIV